MTGWKKLAQFVLVLAFFSGIMFAGGYTLVKDIAPKQRTAAQQEGVAYASFPGVGPDTIANIVEQAGPAVVKINTVVKMNGYNNNPLNDDPFFRGYFGIIPQPQYQSGLGSGFVISKDGYILTNQHVIEGAAEITVLVKGHKKPYPVQLIGAEPSLDLAVLKIEGKDLSTLTLGDSNQIRVGNWVIAIGSPFGLEDTVTTGVISAKERPLEIDGRSFEHLLQTDASINPGNSGGPLLNLKGEVIGINTAINAQAQGIGFAIPTTTVKEVLDELIKQGSVKRPWLGVQISPVTPDILQYLGYEGSTGAVIYRVVPGGPADKAGIYEGDIVLSIDGSKIESDKDLGKTLQKKKVGSQVQMEIFRRGSTVKINVLTEERPAEQ
ncbi:S1C family serine protease [Desulfotomaculum nigrificans]|uniref:S1C family serine protease n=1 Tax=Desulfotomaculum nigrificans TaxID=1565 RepID=UPI0001FAE77A|nr:trypsin-like peptidase domain-containing protein [Desulfotomaculum nigrificans]MDA8235905.1 trypsin-like peptidase domain-containing protein [Clostridia bacterium]